MTSAPDIRALSRRQALLIRELHICHPQVLPFEHLAIAAGIPLRNRESARSMVGRTVADICRVWGPVIDGVHGKGYRLSQLGRELL